MMKGWSVAALLVGFFGFLTLHASELPVGQVGVSPSIFEEVRLEGNELNKTMRFFNFKDKPVSVRVTVHNWTTDHNNRIELLSPDPQSLDQWIVVNPLRFTVPARKSHVVRFSIRPREEPSSGEHRAIIYFTEEPSEPDSLAKETLQNRFRIGTGIYATSGDVKKQALLHSVRVSDNRIDADIENTGTVHTRFRGKYIIWEADAYPGMDDFDRYYYGKPEDAAVQGLVGKGVLNRFPVLPGTRRTISSSLPVSNKKGALLIAVKDTLAGVARVHTFRIEK